MTYDYDVMTCQDVSKYSLYTFLKRKSGRKRNEVKGGWRKQHRNYVSKYYWGFKSKDERRRVAYKWRRPEM
jgi:hypothetical protein